MESKVFGKALVLASLVAALGGGEALAAASTVELDPTPEPARKEQSITVGLGLASVPDYEGSSDNTLVPVPLLRFVDPAGWYVELAGNTLRANVMPKGDWKLGPLARYRMERDDVENDAVDAMKKVDAAIELGAFAGFDNNTWSAKIEVAQDVSNSHDGMLVSLGGGYTFPLDPVRLTLGASTTFASGDYMDTYFGVNASNKGTSGLPDYNPDSGFKDVGASVTAVYRIDKNWGLTGMLRYTRLIGDAADSPLVDDEGSESQVMGAVLVTYTF